MLRVALDHARPETEWSRSVLSDLRFTSSSRSRSQAQIASGREFGRAGGAITLVTVPQSPVDDLNLERCSSRREGSQEHINEKESV
jgi:hypothetical protein